VGRRGHRRQRDPSGRRAVHGYACRRAAEVAASHSVALSQPKAVADLIRTAVTAVSTKTTTA
jgi:hypothetical protein